MAVCYERPSASGNERADWPFLAEWCGREAVHVTCDDVMRHATTDGVPQCPLRRLLANLEAVPLRERTLIEDDIYGRKPLVETLPLKAIKAWLRREPGPEGMKGTEALLVVSGWRGVGKSVAAAYALGRWAGKYVTAYRLARPGVHVRALRKYDLVAVDQLGCENIGKSDFMVSQLEELVDMRYAEMLPTLLVANMKREHFATRYGSLITDRLAGDGFWLWVEGNSLRGAE